MTRRTHYLPHAITQQRVAEVFDRTSGSLTAQQVAERVGVQVATVRAELNQLVAEGVLIRDRDISANGWPFIYQAKAKKQEVA